MVKVSLCFQVLEAVGPIIFLSTDTRKLRNEGFLSPFHPRYPDILTNSAHPMVPLLSWIILISVKILLLAVSWSLILNSMVGLLVNVMHFFLQILPLSESSRSSKCYLLSGMGTTWISCLSR